MTTEEIHQRVAQLVSASHWAETLKAMDNKENAKTPGKYFTTNESQILIFSNDLIWIFGLSPIDTRINGRISSNGHYTGFTMKNRKSMGLINNHSNDYLDVRFDDKRGIMVVCDKYLITWYFDPETSSWKEVKPEQMRDYKILSPEQEERYIKEKLGSVKRLTVHRSMSLIHIP
ncbi:MAG: hypothetical protein HZY76_07095 [Anaerolineae bacterium]|nr:MAG: hypothetical protein HZY76_07095 [Anaerolineae bacterium]